MELNFASRRPCRKSSISTSSSDCLLVSTTSGVVSAACADASTNACWPAEDDKEAEESGDGTDEDGSVR
jgi:hypothetical protein